MYIDGDACGSHIIQYYDDGSVCREVDMNGFLPDGTEFVYHENGALQSKSQYKNGQIVDGKYEIFDENGILQESFICKNGIAKFYHENGCKKRQMYIFRDQFNGLCQEFDSEGNEICSSYYCDGVECESEEGFLDGTFEELADSVFFYYDRQRPDLDETSLKIFFREIYEWVMSLPEASKEYDDYAEILENLTDEEIPLELFVRRLVREFILRLRLPNEPLIEAEMVAKLIEYLKDEQNPRI